MQSRTHLALLCLLLTLATGLACDKASPVVPEGATLVLTVAPGTINSPTGTATVNAIVRTGNGTPVFRGTEVRFDTTLGSIEPLVTTNDQGVATATLRGDGRVGKATVRAIAGAIMPVTVDVLIGTNVSNVSLQATPSTISLSGFPSGGKKIQLLALVRDDQGQPLAGANVNFSTEIGTLQSRGGFVRSNGQGAATDTLTVQLSELSTFQAPTFTVSAHASLGTGNQTATFELRIQRDAPIASFIAHGNSGNNVRFENTTTGAEPISYTWDFTNDGTVDSNVKNPTFTYPNAGTFTVRLVATNSAGSDDQIQAITVPAPP